MLGIGAGALGVAVAARVASAVVDTPVSLPNNEIDHETFLKTMETPGPEITNQMIDLSDMDWDKWLKDFEDFEITPQDFRQESPPIVPAGSFDRYEFQHHYINSDLVIHSDEMNNLDTIKLDELLLTPGTLIPVEDKKDDRLDAAMLGFTGFKNTWDRNE